MEIPEVAKMADLLKTLIAAQDDMAELVKTILNHPDRRTVREQFQATAELSLSTALLRLAEAQNQSIATAKQFAAILYYLDVEATKADQGEWRKIAKAQAHYRISIDAVRSLRQYSGLSLEDARLVVEGYQAGMFR